MTFTLDGQTLTVTDVEIYPTHVRVNVEGDGDNTAWLKGLDFYLENEDGSASAPSPAASSPAETPTHRPWSPTGWRAPYFARCDSLSAAHHRPPVAGKGP